MKKIILLLALGLFTYTVYAENDGDDIPVTYQITVGYTPRQATSLNDEGNAVSVDFMSMLLSDAEESPIIIGAGIGLGIRSYNKINNDAILGLDPYKQSLTRFDLHTGPIIGVVGHGVALFLSPQFGLWYAGMSSEGPKVNFTTTLNADLVLGLVSIGASYSALSRRLVTTDWNIYSPDNSYILVKPALEFRLGIFF